MNSYFNNLHFHDGVYSSSKVSSVYYPAEGNSTFFNVEDSSFWYQHRNNCILEAINKIKPAGKIFEVGGGNGYVSKAIQDSGYEVALIEPDSNGIANAKKRGIKNLVNSSFFDLEWTEKKMENVAIFDVLEHIENDTLFINQLQSRLKKGGYLFLTVPCHNSLFSMEDKHDGHFRRYSLNKLEEKISGCGFNIEYASYIFSYLSFPIYLFKALPTKLRLGKYSSIEKYKDFQSKISYQAEHKVSSVFAKKVLNIFHNFELRKISNLSKIPYGASCLIVAKST